MTTDVHVLGENDPIYDAVDTLIRYRISGAPVIDNSGKVVGVISEKDCLRLLVTGQDHQRADGVVADFMTREVESVPSDMDIYFLAGLLLSKPYRRFPVIDGHRLVGLISRHDVMKAAQSLR
jgi:CBS domain-containing protein